MMAQPLIHYVDKTRVAADDRLDKLREQRTSINNAIDFWEMVKEAYDQMKSPYRDRIVIKSGDEYLATYSYEINPENGWATAGINEEGGRAIMPTRPGDWCLYERIVDCFGIGRSDITFTDKADDYYRERQSITSNG